MKRPKLVILLVLFILILLLFGVSFYWLVASYLDQKATTWFFIGWFSAVATTGLSRAAVAKQ